jgi:hypothetical protein
MNFFFYFLLNITYLYIIFGSRKNSMEQNYLIYLSYFMFLELEFRSLFHCMSSKGGTILDSAHMHQCRLPQNYIVDHIILSQKIMFLSMVCFFTDAFIRIFSVAISDIFSPYL